MDITPQQSVGRASEAFSWGGAFGVRAPEPSVITLLSRSTIPCSQDMSRVFP